MGGEWIEAGDFSFARRYKETAVVAARVFDHVLRNDESYSQKWEYVRKNPVRAGLVQRTDDWPYQGEFAVIDRAYFLQPTRPPLHRNRHSQQSCIGREWFQLPVL
jgi:hypothetical protein